MPKPTVTWYRKSSVKGEPTDRIGTAGEILNIYNITRHCGGVYECEADNGVTPIATKATTVKVKFPPEVKVASDTISQAIGKDTILECTVTGYPHGEAFWEFGFKRLFTSEKYMSEASSYIEEEQKLSIYLTIKNIQSSDFGEYFCFASNDMGHARDKMVLEGQSSFIGIDVNNRDIGYLHSELKSDKELIRSFADVCSTCVCIVQHVCVLFN
uniref:Ig-like domain-containing protein n=1 Tax=Biomphalaria glabrata TaxID=6526 RepID=A0A2C9KMN0_BIOGL